MECTPDINSTETGDPAQVVVAILCNSSYPHLKIFNNGIRQTFLTEKVPGVLVLPYFGAVYSKLLLSRRGKSVRVQPSVSEIRISKESVAYSSTVESLENVAVRFLEILSWAFVSTSCEYFWHSNVSTYLNLINLKQLLDSSPKHRFYGGVISDYSNFKFVSGASVCLSRDLMGLVLTNKANWDYELPWDVALGKLMFELGVCPSSVPRTDFSSVKSIRSIESAALFTGVNFRCKSGKFVRRDAKIMLALHRTLKNSVTD